MPHLSHLSHPWQDQAWVRYRRGQATPEAGRVTPRPGPNVGQDRPRLVAIEGLAVTTPLDPYLGLRALAHYSGCSVRWLRDRLTDGHHPLPCFRLPSGKILVRRGEFDAWMARYRQVGNPEVDRIVNEALAGLKETPLHLPGV